MAKNGPKAMYSLLPFNLNSNNKILIHAANIKAKKIASIVFAGPKNEPTANINLMSPPPSVPGISANKKRIPPPAIIPKKALLKEMSFESKNNIPNIKVIIINLSGITLYLKSTKETTIKIDANTIDLIKAILNENLK